MDFCSLGSGSSGNSFIVKNNQTILMIDCGFGLKETIDRLEKYQINPSKIKLQNFDVLSSLELKNIDGTITIVTPNELIESVNNGTFNILKLIIERDYHESKIYLLGNTNHLLKIKSFTTLSKLQKK